MNTSVESNSRRWFAVQVRTRWECSTAALLEAKGYQTLLPMSKFRGRWGKHVAATAAPLFPGYVFCHFDAQKRLPVLVTPGVIAVVACGRTPLPVDEQEIAAIQKVVSSGMSAEPFPYLEVGQKIRILGEALHGLEGILTKFKGQDRVVLSVSLLKRSVAVEIDRSCVLPLAGSASFEFVPATA